MDTSTSGATSATDEVELFEPAPAHTRFAAGDVVRLVVGAIALVGTLVVGSIATATVDGVEADIVDGIARLPDSIEQLLIGSAQLFATFVPLIVLAAAVYKRRWRILLSVWLGSAIAGVLLPLAVRVVGERVTTTSIRTRTELADTTLVGAEFPTTTYLATAIAGATIGAAYLPRRWRRAVWGWVSILVVLRFLGPGQPPLDILLAASVGSLVGSLVLIVLGSPTTEPTPDDVLAGVRSIRLDPASIERLGESNGSVRYRVTERDGRRTFVKLRTPDDRSWDLLSRSIRATRLRSSEISRPFSSLKRRVEHEALALRTVRDGGTDTPHVVAIGITPGGAAMLAMEYIDGELLSDLEPDDVDDELVRAVFEQISAMHDTRTAHHHLTLDNFIVDVDGRVRLHDFDEAELAANRRNIARDVAEALVAIGTVVGPQRSVASAIAVLGPDSVSASLPLLQPLALSSGLGRRAKQHHGELLDDLRARIHDVTGADDVPLERLARVQPRTLVMIVAGALAFYSLLPQFGNLDDTVDAFGDARLEWIPALLAAATVYYVFATMSFLGSVAERMPVAPSARSQVAASFAQLVGPAGAGKMALAGRFLQRNGLSGPEASASVAINTIAGVVTHLSLMVAFFAWSGGADIGGFSLPSLGTVLVVAAIAAVLLAVAVAIPYTRSLLVTPVVDGLRTAAGYTAQVVKSPLRVLGLLGGSTFITLSYLVGAVFAVEAFGGGISFAQVGAAYLGAAAIANIAPTPGGIGPLEAAMIAGFSGFGMDGGTAISAVLTFRLATFWLPILPGYLTFMWMERRGEI